MKAIKGKNGGTLITREKGDKALPGVGHPGGPNTKTRLNKILSQKYKRINPLSGEEETFTVAEMLDMAMVAEGLGGNVRAYQEIIDRIEGKITQPVEHTGNDFESVSITFVNESKG